jgi:alpha-galactosidase
MITKGPWAHGLLLALLLTTVREGGARLLRPARAEAQPQHESSPSIGLAAKPSAAATSILAETPPLGWNSWDGYGTTVDEDHVKANAEWFTKHLKSYGWEYIVIDMEWFVTNPAAEGNSKPAQYSMDAHGRYTPAPNRFPSSVPDKGFKPLGDYLHSLGLKFGIHILRGIPRKAVEANLPIAGSNYHALDAADPKETCPWNPDNFGIDAAKPGAQAYYDSIATLYASWGVDFIKVDCIASHPYRPDEIRLLSTALAKTGRPIVLSISPGPATVEKLDALRKYAQMWRVSDDVWDLWHSTVEYPQGLGDQFANVAKWGGMAEPGHWPDADMLPLGFLGPAPGWGKPRTTRFTRDEQRTLMTLWSIFPSPLMVGGDLPSADDWTLSLLTNPEVLAVDQRSKGNRVAFSSDTTTVWTAQSNTETSFYVAAFNLTTSLQNVRFTWQQLGLPEGKYAIRDLWEHKDLGSAGSLEVQLPAHGTVLYRLTP